MVYPSLSPESRIFLAQKAREGWEPLLGVPQHPLIPVHGKALDDATIFILGGPINNYGCLYFQLYLLGGEGVMKLGMVAFGLANRGLYPANHWVELISFDAASLTQEGAVRFFGYLLELLPPGGHLMVEYESPGWRSTDLALERGVPPALTPLGSMMHRAGCISFKNWYISEGGREGPRKLQGFKALNQKHRTAKGEETARQVLEFLKRSYGSPEPHLQAAVSRAPKVLRSLAIADPQLRRQVERATPGELSPQPWREIRQ